VPCQSIGVGRFSLIRREDSVISARPRGGRVDPIAMRGERTDTATGLATNPVPENRSNYETTASVLNGTIFASCGLTRN
jgi:hypothetical protein